MTQKTLQEDELQMLALYERDPFFKTLVMFYIQKDGEALVNQILPGLKSKQSKPKRKKFKYGTEELAVKYLQTLDKCVKTMPTQNELEETTGIEQSIWSRMMQQSDFWGLIIVKLQEEFPKMEQDLVVKKEKRIHLLHIAEKKERLLQQEFGDIIKHNGKEVSSIEVCGKSLTELVADISEENDPSEAADRALLNNRSDKELMKAIMKKHPELTLEDFKDISRDTLETFYLDGMGS